MQCIVNVEIWTSKSQLSNNVPIVMSTMYTKVYATGYCLNSSFKVLHIVLSMYTRF